MMGGGVVGGLYPAVSTVFDGTNDYLTKTSDLTGNADSKKLTFSCWVKMAAGGLAASERIYSAGSPDEKNFIIPNYSDNTLLVNFCNAAGTTILAFRTGGTMANTNWHHLAFSVDLSDTGKRKVMVDGMADTPVWTTYTNDTIDFTQTYHTFCAAYSSVYGNFLNASVAELYMNFGAYVDISTAANYAKFARNGKPSYLGKYGSLPTGGAPLIYLKNPYTSFQTNQGTGGNFSLVGTLAAGTTPSY